MLDGICQYVLVFSLVVCVGNKEGMELWVFVYCGGVAMGSGGCLWVVLVWGWLGVVVWVWLGILASSCWRPWWRLAASCSSQVIAWIMGEYMLQIQVLEGQAGVMQSCGVVMSGVRSAVVSC